MKVVAVCGSPRKGGNTEQALNIVVTEISKYNIDAELITMHGKNIQGCKACTKCKQIMDGLCHGRDDDLNPIHKKCIEADAIILGSPVYFGSATPEIKCLIDRMGYSSRAAGGILKNKIGGAVVVARRAGQNFTFAQISFFFGINGMIQIGSSYWNILYGKEKGDINKDEEGIATLTEYAKSLAWALKKLKE